MPITPFIHVTVAFSNAVLVAILPHVSNCAKQLDLPIPQPITIGQIAQFRPYNMQGMIGGGITLTNGFQFGFGSGFVNSFRSPHDFFNDPAAQAHWPPDWSSYYGTDNMTTNEAIEMARTAFRRLGYKLEDFHMDGPPTSIEAPFSLRDGNHIPFCKVHWDTPKSMIQTLLRNGGYHVNFEIDMQRKQLVGMNLAGRDFFRPQPKVDIVPELESDYQKRVKTQTSPDTNSPLPKSLQGVQPPRPLVSASVEHSNAMLNAALPHVSNFVQKLKLPLAQPLETSQVVASHPSDSDEPFFNVLIFTNHYWFMVLRGHVVGFGSPDDWFNEKATRTDWPRYSNNDCLTTNAAIELARNTFRRLGYPLEDYHLDRPPTEFENAVGDSESNVEQTRYAYCRITWQGSDIEHDEGYQFDVDMQQKQVVGMGLVSTNFGVISPSINATTESKSDSQKQMQFQMFVRTNAPKHWPFSQATNLSSPIPPTSGQKVRQD
jgi:hypothetical protein